jgi:hypothetical protein
MIADQIRGAEMALAPSRAGELPWPRQYHGLGDTIV